MLQTVGCTCSVLHATVYSPQLLFISARFVSIRAKSALQFETSSRLSMHDWMRHAPDEHLQRAMTKMNVELHIAKLRGNNALNIGSGNTPFCGKACPATDCTSKCCQQSHMLKRFLQHKHATCVQEPLA